MRKLAFFVLFILSLNQPAIAATPSLFAAYDYGFSGPDTLPAGVTTLEIVNQGQDLHHIQVIRLVEGKTSEDFQQALKSDPGRLPKWAVHVGGPNAIVPGERASATTKLEPGTYVLVCWIPDKRNIPHVALGMVKPIRVVGALADTAKLPNSDLEITEADFIFLIPAAISPGKHNIYVRNNGTQVHEVLLVQLAPDTSILDFARAFEPGAFAPPPGKPVGGITGLEPGAEGVFAAQFISGKYGLICFFPDERGMPHFSRGMMTEFTVRQ
jgi:uncharacterized cupredoxin-like copper-binding protein